MSSINENQKQARAINAAKTEETLGNDAIALEYYHKAYSAFGQMLENSVHAEKAGLLLFKMGELCFKQGLNPHKVFAQMLTFFDAQLMSNDDDEKQDADFTPMLAACDRALDMLISDNVPPNSTGLALLSMMNRIRDRMGYSNPGLPEVSPNFL